MKNLLLLAIAVNCSGAFAAVMRLQVCVVDADSGEPIAGAEVGAGFYNPPLFWGGESQDMHRDGVTDKHGRCSLVGRSSRGRCGVTVRVPDKYYNGFGQCQLNEADRNQLLVPHFHSMTVALHRVKSPIPMFVNKISLSKDGGIFRDADVVQYDLMKGDWMPPKGAGEVADVEFVRHATEELGLGTNGAGFVAMRLRNRMTIKFLGEGCGIVSVEPFVNSALKWRTAPEDGYKSEYVCVYTDGQDLQPTCSWGDDQCLCFRIRVKKGGKGEIEEAYYGKIYEGVKLYFKHQPKRSVAGLGFEYYLNPTSMNRNLEYDMKHHLNSKMRREYSCAP